MLLTECNLLSTVISYYETRNVFLGFKDLQKISKFRKKYGVKFLVEERNFSKRDKREGELQNCGAEIAT